MSLLSTVGNLALRRDTTLKASTARNRWSSDIASAATLSGAYTSKQYYGLLWYFYQNTIYTIDTLSDKFAVATTYRNRQRIFPRTTGIYNPTTRLVNEYTANTFGGALDLDAGMGDPVRSAIPIITRNEAIRPALSAVWKASNFDVTKSDFVRYGHILGNVGLRIIDDPLAGKVRFEVVPPWEVTDLQLDSYGNVTRWRQEYPTEMEFENDRTGKIETVEMTFSIEITRESFKTFLNDEPFAFDEFGGVAEWANPYGFVPCVWVKNINAGSDLGLCTFHNSIPTINAMAQTASHLVEQVAKSVYPQYMLSGTSAPKSEKLTGGRTVWITPNPQARAEILNDKLDIPGVVGFIEGLVKEMERDYPILGYYVIRSRMGSGDLTGRAVQTILHDVIKDVEERRVPYDSALIRAHKMALSIGGFRGYKNFESFDLQQAFEEGQLDHSIGTRNLVPEDETEKLNYATQVAALGETLMNLANPPKPVPTGGGGLTGPGGVPMPPPEPEAPDPITVEELAQIVQEFQVRIKTGTLRKIS